VDLKVVFLDDNPAPYPRHQFIFRDNRALRRGQDAENVERPAAELYRLVAAAQFASSTIEPEPAEADIPSAIGLCRFRTINF